MKKILFSFIILSFLFYSCIENGAYSKIKRTSPNDIPTLMSSLSNDDIIDALDKVSDTLRKVELGKKITPEDAGAIYSLFTEVARRRNEPNWYDPDSFRDGLGKLFKSEIDYIKADTFVLEISIAFIQQDIQRLNQ